MAFITIESDATLTYDTAGNAFFDRLLDALAVEYTGPDGYTVGTEIEKGSIKTGVIGANGIAHYIGPDAPPVFYR
jgi:hypothetical protein